MSHGVGSNEVALVRILHTKSVMQYSSLTRTLPTAHSSFTHTHHSDSIPVMHDIQFIHQITVSGYEDTRLMHYLQKCTLCSNNHVLSKSVWAQKTPLNTDGYLCAQYYRPLFSIRNYNHFSHQWVDPIRSPCLGTSSLVTYHNS